MHAFPVLYDELTMFAVSLGLAGRKFSEALLVLQQMWKARTCHVHPTPDTQCLGQAVLTQTHAGAWQKGCA